MPDGKVLIGHGVNRSPSCTVDGRACTFEEREGHHFQMFDPATGAVRQLAKTTVSRGLHGTATLLPDASVFFAGENREALVRPDDPSFPLETSYAGVLPAGDPDQGVPVGQLFFPSYLFNQDGSRAARPAIRKSPAEISYRGNFDITIAGDSREIASVVMLRSDHNTHSLTTGDRYVKLALRRQGGRNHDDPGDDQRDTRGRHGNGDDSGGRNELRVTAPNVPAQAIPGIYMLFVVDQNGVPSVGRKLVVRAETRGKRDRD